MKAFCIGRNYADHAKELNNQIPQDPVVFIKHEDCFYEPKNDVWQVPPTVQVLHYEAEVVFRFAKDLNQPLHINTPTELFGILDSVSIGIDFTDRAKQDELKNKGLPWEKAKAFKNAALLGSFILMEEHGLLHDNIDFTFSLNGKVTQQSNTSKMLFNVRQLVMHIASLFVIKKGDLLFTGTPAGVGLFPASSHLEAELNQIKVLDIVL